MVEPGSLPELLNERVEWLGVFEDGTVLTLRSDEVELEEAAGRWRFGFFARDGFRVRRLVAARTDGAELELELADGLGTSRETLRLIPRQSAAELGLEVELARLERAGKIARAAAEEREARVRKVALAAYNGRLANITLVRGKAEEAVLADVTGRMSHEALLAAAIKRLDELHTRKKNPLDRIAIAGEKRQIARVRKLAALLRPGYRSSLELLTWTDRDESETIGRMQIPNLAELWREKPGKLALPDELVPGELAAEVLERSPDKIDIIYSRHGETLRFRGLPFLRTRRLGGKEHAWFGLGRQRRSLNEETRAAFHDMLDLLHRNRDPEPETPRHELYSLRPEAWIESTLRRDIRRLDGNLILAPVYNQFRSAGERIDLLALRRDGRLVIIELKSQPDRDSVFQAADYWRRIELQRRRGVLRAAGLFGPREIADRPALIYIAAPALSFHRELERFAAALLPELEMWQFVLHSNWRREIKVIDRKILSGR